MEWIDVKERLPNIKKNDIYSDDVLVYDRARGFYVGKYYVGKHMDVGYWIAKETGCRCCSTNLDVTHWAELPKGPKHE